MPAVPQTSNLGLQLPPPDVYDSPAPNWGAILNANFQKLDALGNPIPTSRLNINADLSFNGYSATNLKTAAFRDQGATLASSFLQSVYVANGNLYYNNGSGTAVRITLGNSVDAGAGNIGGLPSTPAGAAVNYSNASGFTFLGFGGNIYSPIVAGSLSIFDTAAGPPTHGIVVKSPTSLAADYSLTLPPSLPASGKAYALVSDDAGVTSFAQLTKAQMAAQSPATIAITGSFWSGSVEWWQDQAGMVHLQGAVQRTSGTTRTPGITIPVPPAAGSAVFVLPSNDVSLVPSSAYAIVSGAGVLTFLADIPANQTVYLDMVAYLGST